MTVAVLFPGQGSQTAGFLHRLPGIRPVRDVLERASTLLGLDVLTLDTDLALTSTITTQIALVVCGAAFHGFLVSEGVALRAVAGMSVGTYAAALACGAINLETALRLVRHRAYLMETAFPNETYGMAAIQGLRLAQLQAILQNENLSVANLNSFAQFVVAGPRAQLEQFLDHATQAGATTVSMLPMSVPSHIPQLLPSSRELFDMARELPVQAPSLPMFSNRDARPITTTEGVREELAMNMAAPLRWHDIMSALNGLGIELFLESPPGRTLTGLALQFEPKVRALSAAETRWDVLIAATRTSPALQEAAITTRKQPPASDLDAGFAGDLRNLTGRVGD